MKHKKNFLILLGIWFLRDYFPKKLEKYRLRLTGQFLNILPTWLIGIIVRMGMNIDRLWHS
ncbi:MAG TPA: hypothetical protein PLH12_04560, partial [Pseudomonadales bacterium]|nr:hypothetical protein [Pseudomonadales bacterium]